MSSANDPSLPEGLEAVVQRQVKAAVEAKIVEYWKIIRAFLLGLGLLVALLVANRLLSPESLLVMLHDQIFGFDKHLTRVMSRNVNFSYSNQFWLQAKDQTQYMAFYANKTQKVSALIEIKHTGVGEPRTVSIRLDDSPLWEGTDSIENRLWDLTDLIKKPAQLALGENIHMLTFRADNRAEHAGDRVFVRVLTNIIGLEE